MPTILDPGEISGAFARAVGGSARMMGLDREVWENHRLHQAARVELGSGG